MINVHSIRVINHNLIFLLFNRDFPLKYFFFMYKLDKLMFYMKTTEKIANAKKRIHELENLIKYWNDSEERKAKIVSIPIEIENKVA